MGEKQYSHLNPPLSHVLMKPFLLPSSLLSLYLTHLIIYIFSFPLEHGSVSLSFPLRHFYLRLHLSPLFLSSSMKVHLHWYYFSAGRNGIRAQRAWAVMSLSVRPAHDTACSHRWPQRCRMNNEVSLRAVPSLPLAFVFNSGITHTALARH